jgi:hypothetical protein
MLSTGHTCPGTRYEVRRGVTFTVSVLKNPDLNLHQQSRVCGDDLLTPSLLPPADHSRQRGGEVYLPLLYVSTQRRETLTSLGCPAEILLTPLTHIEATKTPR